MVRMQSRLDGNCFTASQSGPTPAERVGAGAEYRQQTNYRDLLVVGGTAPAGCVETYEPSLPKCEVPVLSFSSAGVEFPICPRLDLI